MEHLVRTRNGDFGIEAAFRVDEIASMAGKMIIVLLYR